MVRIRSRASSAGVGGEVRERQSTLHVEVHVAAGTEGLERRLKRNARDIEGEELHAGVERVGIDGGNGAAGGQAIGERLNVALGDLGGADLVVNRERRHAFGLHGQIPGARDQGRPAPAIGQADVFVSRPGVRAECVKASEVSRRRQRVNGMREKVQITRLAEDLEHRLEGIVRHVKRVEADGIRGRHQLVRVIDSVSQRDVWQVRRVLGHVNLKRHGHG